MREIQPDRAEWQPVGWSGSTFRVQMTDQFGSASITVRHKPKGGTLDDRIEVNRLLALRLCRYIARHGAGAALGWLGGRIGELPDA